MKKINLKKLCSTVLLILAISNIVAQNTSLPYFNGFENPSDTVGWTFKKRPGKTGFVVGTATHCFGYKSMYTSPDSGATATYTGGGYVSIAYKSFTLPAGTYQLAFDYQMGGDGTNQKMKVAWVPSNITLNATSMGNSWPNAISLYQFTDATFTNEFGMAAWSHVTGTITVPAGGGTYNLCFAFKNNSQTVTEPGACVDNIQLDTIKGLTDCTKVPTNIQVVKDAQQGVIITWSGNATQYEVIAASSSDPQDNSYCWHTGITTTSDTMLYSELGEGQYFFYVRAICDSDTSMFGEISGVSVYDVSAHCIDFVTFNAPGTQCTYGTYSNPYQTNGYIDNGSNQMSSRHTVHTDPSETDARTNNALHTVPTGEVLSVRLGNWNDGSEAESITYTYNVPAGSSLILMLKYAVVFEEPGHDEAPEFKLEIMNTNNVLLDSACTYVDVLCDGTLTNGWHSCTYSDGGATTTVWYKDWTTIGMNLTQYAGQTIKIRLTSYDCNWAGHFGYGYFTLGCMRNEILGMSCGSGESSEIKAPDGFNYSWRNDCTGQVVSTAQSLPVAGTDTCTYTCTCTSKEDSSCSFILTGYTIPRLPESKFTYTMTYSDCQTHINFINTSEVYVINGSVKTYLPNERITSQTWSVGTAHTNRSYYNRTSGAKNLSQIDVPKEGDTISVTLTAWANGCDDDTVVTLYVPALQESYGQTNRYVCNGTPVSLNQKTYTFLSRDSIEVMEQDGTTSILRDTVIQVIDTLSSWCGCDSVLELKVKSLIADTIYLDTTVCSKLHIVIPKANETTQSALDTTITTAGRHVLRVSSSQGCDSLILDINVTLIGGVYVAVSVNNASWGSVTGGGVYAENDTVTLVANANGHYHFVAWSNGATTPTLRFVVTADTSLTAIFAIDRHTVNTVSTNPACGSVTGGGTYDYGEEITLTAIVNANCHFVSWNNGDTSQTITHTVVCDTTISALIVKDLYTVTVLANYADRGEVTGSGQHFYNDYVTVTATPNSGYEFRGWSNGETDNVLSFYVTGDTVLTAIFEEQGTGVEEVAEGNDVVLTPNPVQAGESVIISSDSEIKSVEVYNMDGVCVQRIEHTNGFVVVDGLTASGIYIVKITNTNGSSATRKIIVE